jgi:hypothetical protein
MTPTLDDLRVALHEKAHRAVLQPAEPGLGSFSANAAGAGFPEFFQGIRRVTVLDAPMLARMKPDYTPSVAAPKGSKIHAAIYETVPWQEYPFPPRPTGERTPSGATCDPFWMAPRMAPR